MGGVKDPETRGLGAAPLWPWKGEWVLGGYYIRQTWVSVPALLFTSCVILGKVLTLSELKVLYLQRGQSTRDCIGCLEDGMK